MVGEYRDYPNVSCNGFTCWHCLHSSRTSNRWLNAFRPRQNGRHFTDAIFKCILLYFPKGPINNIAALVQIMAWHRPGDEPLSEPMIVGLPTHMCVTRPRWAHAKSPIYQQRFHISFHQSIKMLWEGKNIVEVLRNDAIYGTNTTSIQFYEMLHHIEHACLN